MNRNLIDVTKNLLAGKQSLPDIELSGISTDSDTIKRNNLFVAIKGNDYDGHDYIKQAIESGAAAVVSDRHIKGQLPVPQVRVSNTRKALSKIASEFYGNPSLDLKVIGITGTNGKTSTASIVTSILLEAGFKTAQIGTLGLIADGFENEKGLTTPDALTLQKLLSELKSDGFTHVVMEVSSHSLDQFRVKDINFDIAAFTNLSHEHLDYHKTMEAYFDAKLKLFKMLSVDAKIVLNKSDPYSERIRKSSKSTVLEFSVSKKSSVHYEYLSLSIDGIRGCILAHNERYLINSSLIGDFNSENILAAVSIAYSLGISKSNIESGISKCGNVPGRMEIHQLRCGAKVVLDYAHTEVSYKKIFKTIYRLINDIGSIYSLFGAGGDRDKMKRPKMGRIAEKYSKHVYLTPDNPRTEDPKKIMRDIVKGFIGNKYTWYDDRGRGLRTAIEELNKDDILVVLGKGQENYQEVRGKRFYHSDTSIIEEYK